MLEQSPRLTLSDRPMTPLKDSMYMLLGHRRDYSSKSDLVFRSECVSDRKLIPACALVYEEMTVHQMTLALKNKLLKVGRKHFRDGQKRVALVKHLGLPSKPLPFDA